MPSGSDLWFELEIDGDVLYPRIPVDQLAEPFSLRGDRYRTDAALSASAGYGAASPISEGTLVLGSGGAGKHAGIDFRKAVSPCFSDSQRSRWRAATRCRRDRFQWQLFLHRPPPESIVRSTLEAIKGIQGKIQEVFEKDPHRHQAYCMPEGLLKR